MLTNTVWSIPYLLLGIVCLGVATVYTFVWPKPKAGKIRPAWRQVVLRWFHSLVWVLLAAACFFWTASLDSTLAPFLARLALLTYIIFLVTITIERRATT